MIKETLDEAIKALVFCSEGLCEYCPFNKEDRNLCEDAKCAVALGYLKEYKKNCEDLINATKDLKKQYILNNLTNNRTLLTWDELKTMEGKPVWVEAEPINGWVIVEIRDSFMKGREYIKFGLLELSNKDLGKTWKVYRKERK